MMNKWIEEMLRQKAENEKLLRQIEQELSHAPKGQLRMSHQHGEARFYQAGLPNQRNPKYLGIEDAALRDHLAQKKYDLAVKKALEKEQAIINRVLKKDLPSAIEVYEAFPEDMRKCIQPHVLTDDQFVELWMKEMLAGASGEDFKSRIEIIIDQDYTKFGCPHVYEPSLYLEGYGFVRPDFVVLNVRTRQTFYHEHLGMMGDPDYRANNMKKLRAYHNNGFYEGINLIITMESDGMMIDNNEMEAIIKTYCI